MFRLTFPWLLKFKVREAGFNKAGTFLRHIEIPILPRYGF
jgi:hypothetical protein